jgi:hypothetical protein
MLLTTEGLFIFSQLNRTDTEIKLQRKGVWALPTPPFVDSSLDEKKMKIVLNPYLRITTNMKNGRRSSFTIRLPLRAKSEYVQSWLQALSTRCSTLIFSVSNNCEELVREISI